MAIVSHPSLPAPPCPCCPSDQVLAAHSVLCCLLSHPPCPPSPLPPYAHAFPLTRYLLPTRYFAVYYPTPDPIIERMLRLANVSAKDTVYDLGCGDGRGE